MTGSDAPTEKEKMLAGALYRGGGAARAADEARAERLVRIYNALPAEAAERRAALLADLLGSVGPGAVLRSPFICEYGFNIHLGPAVFANFGCIFLDVGRIEIGEACQIGTCVQIVTADH